VAVPCAGLCGSLGWFEDAGDDALVASHGLCFMTTLLTEQYGLEAQLVLRKEQQQV